MARMASGSPDDALDIVQDTMLDFARLYANRPEGEWNVLFYKILHSRITDWYRRTAVRRRFHDWFGKPRNDEDDEEDPMARVADSTSPDPAEGVMRQEFTGALQAALRKLPLRQQQAFVLRAWEGFDTAQTAQAMGCSEGSVKTHYSRAVHALQIKLEVAASQRPGEGRRGRRPARAGVLPDSELDARRGVRHGGCGGDGFHDLGRHASTGAVREEPG